MQNHPTSWLSKSIFYVKNYPNLSQFFFHWRISISEHIFCYWHFLIASIFKSLSLLKWCPIFKTSPLTQFPKFDNFLWVCWFLGKNLSNFVPPVWKLHNPYCHKVHSSFHISLFCKCTFLLGNKETKVFTLTKLSKLGSKKELSTLSKLALIKQF